MKVFMCQRRKLKIIYSWLIIFERRYIFFRILISYLNLFKGNVTFTTEEDEVKIIDTNSMNKTADLLQVNAEELKRTLCERVIAARGEIMQKSHTLIEAEFGKNALAKVWILVNELHVLFLLLGKKKKFK